MMAASSSFSVGNLNSGISEMLGILLMLKSSLPVGEKAVDRLKPILSAAKSARVRKGRLPRK